MPPGKVHHQVWNTYKPHFMTGYIAAEIAISGYALIRGDEFSRLAWSFCTQIYFWCAVFYLMADYIDPDLDQLGATRSDWKMLKTPVLGWLLYPYWALYASAMAALARLLRVKGMFGTAHRSWLTHSIFPGTQIRCLFFNVPLYITLLVIKDRFGLPDFINILTILPFILGQHVGMGQADWLHVWMDNHNGEGDDDD